MDENLHRIEGKVDQLEGRVDTLEEKVSISEYWRIGNGSQENSADYRLTWLMNNAITRVNIHQIVHDVVREVLRKKRKEGRMDWNKWVNTGLLILTAVMVAAGFLGGTG